MKKKLLLILICMAVLFSATSCGESMNDHIFHKSNLHTQNPKNYVYEINEKIHIYEEGVDAELASLVIRNAFFVEEDVVQVNYEVAEAGVYINSEDFIAYDAAGSLCTKAKVDGEYTQYCPLFFRVDEAGDYLELELRDADQTPFVRIRAYYNVGASELDPLINALLFRSILIMVFLLTVILLLYFASKERKKQLQSWMDRFHDTDKREGL